MARILLVEDDVSGAELVKRWLEEDKHVVDSVHNGADGEELTKQNKYDLLILDWQLPERSGIDIIREFRSNAGNCPIMLVTGRAAIDDKVTGFSAGADDYLPKPFEPKELLLRVRALLRRPPSIVEAKLDLAGITIELDRHKVQCHGSEVLLKPREYALLEFLMHNPNIVFSAENLRNRLWEFEDDITDVGIRVLISRLRNKLGGEASPISTVYGVGYKFST